MELGANIMQKLFEIQIKINNTKENRKINILFNTSLFLIIVLKKWVI